MQIHVLVLKKLLRTIGVYIFKQQLRYYYYYYYLDRFIRKSAKKTNKETRLTKIWTQEDYAVKNDAIKWCY